MPRIKVPLSVSNTEDLENLRRFTAKTLSDVVDVINGNLDFGDNVRCKIQTVNFLASNSDTQIAHGLGYVPTGYIVVGQSATGTVYDGSQAKTNRDIWLKCTAAITVKLLIF